MKTCIYCPDVLIDEDEHICPSCGDAKSVEQSWRCRCGTHNAISIDRCANCDSINPIKPIKAKKAKVGKCEFCGEQKELIMDLCKDCWKQRVEDYDFRLYLEEIPMGNIHWQNLRKSINKETILQQPDENGMMLCDTCQKRIPKDYMATSYMCFDCEPEPPDPTP